MSKEEQDDLRNEVYELQSIHFVVWGLGGLLIHTEFPKFKGQYVKILQRVFRKMKLNPLGFHLDLKSQLTKSLRFALKQVFFDIVDRYEHLEDLDDDEIHQLKEDIYNIGKYKKVRCCAVYGQQPIQNQRKQLKMGPQVVSGTPGRMLDHIKRKNQ